MLMHTNKVKLTGFNKNIISFTALVPWERWDQFAIAAHRDGKIIPIHITAVTTIMMQLLHV